MVLRKPYAFIIKNFKKIHILLLVLSIYIFFTNSQIMSFVNEFIATNTYNPLIESIRNYISPLNYLVLLVVIGISAILIYVLHYKKKPWKAYLLPFLSYIFIYGVVMSTAGYFNKYGDDSTIVTIRALSQLLQLGSLLQYAIFVLLFIRITGVDLKKFDFVHDEEYLEIKEEDREEFEINVEFDKESVVRFLKKQVRQAKYLYHEHPIIFNTIFAGVFLILMGYGYYYFGILHKTYQEREKFSALSYDIVIEKSYFTDKNYSGDIINSKKDYVAVIVRVKNNGLQRALNISRFHLLNRNHMYSSTNDQNPSFKDLGSIYPTRELKAGEEVKFYLVFEVDKNLSNNNFALYYQDIRNNEALLTRKIKLKPVDLHKTETVTTKKINEPMTLSGIGISKSKIDLTEANILDEASYSIYACTFVNNCSMVHQTVQNPGGKILALSFDAADFDDQDFVDFSMTYGKIIYKDNKEKTYTMNLVNAVSKDYEGTKLYLKVPNEISEATSLQFIYRIRNREYVYQIK